MHTWKGGGGSVSVLISYLLCRFSDCRWNVFVLQIRGLQAKKRDEVGVKFQTRTFYKYVMVTSTVPYTECCMPVDGIGDCVPRMVQKKSPGTQVSSGFDPNDLKYDVINIKRRNKVN